MLMKMSTVKNKQDLCNLVNIHFPSVCSLASVDPTICCSALFISSSNDVAPAGELEVGVKKEIFSLSQWLYMINTSRRFVTGLKTVHKHSYKNLEIKAQSKFCHYLGDLGTSYLTTETATNYSNQKIFQISFSLKFYDSLILNFPKYSRITYKSCSHFQIVQLLSNF